jgi:hypothetical protein
LPYCDLSRRDRRQSADHLVGQGDGHVRRQASLSHHFPGIAAYIFGGVRVTVPVTLITAFTVEMIVADWVVHSSMPNIFSNADRVRLHPGDVHGRKDCYVVSKGVARCSSPLSSRIRETFPIRGWELQ